MKRRCRLWEITPDSQRLTKYAAHLDCFKPGQMCIIPTQHPDIQQLSHRHCTSTSKTFRHELSPQRQHFPQFTAVAEQGETMNAAQNALGGDVRFRRPPQRQRFPQFTAIAEQGEMMNAAQNARGGGVRFRRPPQRQRFPQFTAIAEGSEDLRILLCDGTEGMPE